jgi:hypothetical protein
MARRRPTEVVVSTPADLRTLSIQISDRLDEMSIDTSLIAAQARAAMASVPDGLLGVRSALRARAVAWYLQSVADLCAKAAGYAGGTYIQFVRLYAKELEGKK